MPFLRGPSPRDHTPEGPRVSLAELSSGTPHRGYHVCALERCPEGLCIEGDPQEVGESLDKGPEPLVWTLLRGPHKLPVTSRTLAASLGPCKCLPRTPQDRRKPDVGLLGAKGALAVGHASPSSRPRPNTIPQSP